MQSLALLSSKTVSLFQKLKIRVLCSIPACTLVITDLVDHPNIEVMLNLMHQDL